MAMKDEKPNMLPMLKAAIKEKKLGRLYFFHGEEGFLRNHYLSQMKKILVDELTESFNYHKLTKETFDLRTFADAVESLPMMAETTFVVVDDIDIFKFNEDEREKLIAVLCDIPAYCTVVFLYESVTWNPDKRLKKLYEAVQNFGTEVEFAKQEYRDLINWITRHFAANKKQITPDLCSYLIDITDGTMTSLAGEISKICAYSEADRIVKSDIDAVTEPVLDAVVFEMTNLMASGKYPAALMKLQQLLKMQEEPISLLGMIGRQFRQISTTRILIDNGKGVADVMRLCGVREYPAKKLMESARRFSVDFCEKASGLILETDYGMKTSLDEPERLLEVLVMELAREARNG